MAPGAVLAPGYEVIAHLSRNQAMDVYDVWDVERDCRAVAKMQRPDRVEEQRITDRLLSEGRLLTGLAHPHLVRGYELLPGPPPVVIMETLTGATLDYVLGTSRRRLPLTDISFLGMQLCSALQYLHRHGVVHLDVKPGNIVCEETGQAKLIDLSLARAPGPIRRGVGTRDYCAPEQARGGVVDERADVWGVGAVLYECAAGVRAFVGGDGPQRYAQLDRRPVGLRQRRRVPARFAELVDGCLAPAPGDRPALRNVSAELDRLASAAR